MELVLGFFKEYWPLLVALLFGHYVVPPLVDWLEERHRRRIGLPIKKKNQGGARRRTRASMNMKVRWRGGPNRRRGALRVHRPDAKKPLF